MYYFYFSITVYIQYYSILVSDVHVSSAPLVSHMVITILLSVSLYRCEYSVTDVVKSPLCLRLLHATQHIWCQEGYEVGCGPQPCCPFALLSGLGFCPHLQVTRLLERHLPQSVGLFNLSSSSSAPYLLSDPEILWSVLFAPGAGMILVLRWGLIRTAVGGPSRFRRLSWWGLTLILVYADRARVSPGSLEKPFSSLSLGGSRLGRNRTIAAYIHFFNSKVGSYWTSTFLQLFFLTVYSVYFVCVHMWLCFILFNKCILFHRVVFN